MDPFQHPPPTPAGGRKPLWTTGSGAMAVDGKWRNAVAWAGSLRVRCGFVAGASRLSRQSVHPSATPPAPAFGEGPDSGVSGCRIQPQGLSCRIGSALFPYPAEAPRLQVVGREEPCP